MSRWHSSIARDDSELTAYLEIPPGHNMYRLPVLTHLDVTLADAKDLLGKKSLKRLEGEDIEMTAADWDNIENEALKVLEAKKPR